jgi:hypothetical protein
MAALGLGTPLLLLVWFRPDIGLLAIVFFAASFVPPDIIDVRLPIGGLELRDLAMLGMFGLLSLQGLVRKNLLLPWWPVGIPLLVFLGFALFSAFYALFFQGVEYNWAFRDLRGVSFYIMFFVTAWTLAQQRRWDFVLGGLFILADLTAAIVILQQFFGLNNQLLGAMAGANTNWQVGQQAAGSGSFGAVRIVPPGHLLMYFMMVIAFCLFVFTSRGVRSRVGYLLQFIFLNLGLLLTYTRAQWVAAVIALSLVILFLVAVFRGRSMQPIVTSLSLLMLFVFVFGYLSTLLEDGLEAVPVVEALADRAISIVQPEETLSTNSLEWRIFEAEQGLRAVSDNPWLGVALGNSYRDISLMQGEARGLRTGGLHAGKLSRFTRYLHSSYLSILVKMGIPTFMGFLWFCLAFLSAGWRLYRRLPLGQHKAVVLGILCGFVGLMQWSILHSHFVEIESTAVVGLITGLVAAIHRVGEQAGSEPLEMSGGMVKR